MRNTPIRLDLHVARTLVPLVLFLAFYSQRAPLAATSSTVAAPAVPSNPRPVDGANNVERILSLSWCCTDPEGPPREWDVYFGTSSPPPMVGTMQYPQWGPAGSFPLGALEPSRVYYWKVVVRDTQNQIATEGPIWTFTTRAPNPPPPTPCNPVSPADHATNVPLSLPLGWYSCGGANPSFPYFLYDVYFGTNPSPPKVATNVPAGSTQYGGYFAGGLLQNTDYYWKIVNRDIDGYESPGPTWTFRTKSNPDDNITMGLYSDAQGTSCALSDAGGPGVRIVYVVINGPTALTSCRFAAPIPPCFDATWVADSTPYPVIGTSPQDVSVAFGACLTPPIQVMSIAYLSKGSTQGCCSFPLLANAWPGYIVTDCNYVQRDARNFPVLEISADNSCPSCGPVAIKPTTWGALKALYR
jgi:hypothetical protein